ncbi:MAG: 30S ribosomal protein S16 [Pedobacter sp.]|nr:MAG: 30S ribosomal protein S16 [Pedobacter sp.]
MLKIRLKRLGRKKKPSYKIVLMENLSKRDGKDVGEIGCYNPMEKSLVFKKDKLVKAIQHGAYPTDTVRHLIYRIINKSSEK